MNKAYSEKLIDVKEKEAIKEFEIGKLKKEVVLIC